MIRIMNCVDFLQHRAREMPRPITYVVVIVMEFQACWSVLDFTFPFMGTYNTTSSISEEFCGTMNRNILSWHIKWFTNYVTQPPKVLSKHDIYVVHLSVLLDPMRTATR